MAGRLRYVDAVTVRVRDLDAGLDFYGGVLGHELIWRNDALGQIGLRTPEGATEIVLTTNFNYEPNWKVDSAEAVGQVFADNGGRVIAAPREIPIGYVVVVEDPFGNTLVLLDASKGTYQTDADGRVSGVT